MYVCICNQVTDHEIEVAVKSGCNTFDSLCNELQVGQVCGQCSCLAKDLLHQAIENKDKAEKKSA